MLSELAKKIKSFYRRQFNIKETLFILTYNKPIFLSWGASQIVNCENRALCFMVNGNHHSGYVVIVLDWNDTYLVHFIDKQGKLIDSKKEVYFDMLVDVIDTRIEKIEEYSF
jgi:hypothetical protein